MLALEDLLADEQRLFRAVDYGVIIEALYAFAEKTLGVPAQGNDASVALVRRSAANCNVDMLSFPP
jgi:hypothetical protein